MQGPDGVNRMGIGSRVRVYAGGALLGDREIAVGYGWCSGQEADAHFGLGAEETVDVEVTWPHNKGKTTLKGVKADQRLTVKKG